MSECITRTLTWFLSNSLPLIKVLVPMLSVELAVRPCLLSPDRVITSPPPLLKDVCSCLEPFSRDLTLPTYCHSIN